MISINGYDYADSELVTWDDAEEEGGFYFNRARYLGLPRPPAILFARDDPGYFEAMGRYHQKFVQAEADRISREISREDWT